MSSLLYHTIKIRVPEELISVSNKGVLTISRDKPTIDIIPDKKETKTKKPKLKLDDNITKEIERINKLNTKLKKGVLKIPKTKTNEPIEKHFEKMKKYKWDDNKDTNIQNDIEDAIKDYNRWVTYYNKLLKDNPGPKNEYFYRVMKDTEDAFDNVNKKLSLLNPTKVKKPTVTQFGETLEDLEFTLKEKKSLINELGTAISDPEITASNKKKYMASLTELLKSYPILENKIKNLRNSSNNII
jgi:uncharacterized coiled-coil protein SlyX